MYILNTTLILVTLLQTSWTKHVVVSDKLLVQELKILCSTTFLNLEPLTKSSTYLAETKANEMKIDESYPKEDDKAPDTMSTLYCTMYFVDNVITSDKRISQIAVNSDPNLTIPTEYKVDFTELNRNGGTVVNISGIIIRKAANGLFKIIGDPEIAKEISMFKIVEAGIFFDQCSLKNNADDLGTAVELLLALRLQKKDDR